MCAMPKVASNNFTLCALQRKMFYTNLTDHDLEHVDPMFAVMKCCCCSRALSCNSTRRSCAQEP